jgi:hypothetical protein
MEFKMKKSGIHYPTNIEIGSNEEARGCWRPICWLGTQPQLKIDQRGTRNIKQHRMCLCQCVCVSQNMMLLQTPCNGWSLQHTTI